MIGPPFFRGSKMREPARAVALGEALDSGRKAIRRPLFWGRKMRENWVAPSIAEALDSGLDPIRLPFFRGSKMREIWRAPSIAEAVAVAGRDVIRRGGSKMREPPRAVAA